MPVDRAMVWCWRMYWAVLDCWVEERVDGELLVVRGGGTVRVRSSRYGHGACCGQTSMSRMDSCHLSCLSCHARERKAIWAHAFSVQDGIARAFVGFFDIQVVAFGSFLCRVWCTILGCVLFLMLLFALCSCCLWVLCSILSCDAQPRGVEFAEIEKDWN